MRRLAGISLVLAACVALALTLPAAASNGKPLLRVDRPSQGPATRVTVVHLVSGTLSHRMSGRVLTDTRCNPDSMGVSHCLNRVRLANGAVITVGHDHRMADIPCLSPGERITISPRW
jgi:hypothetical protein